MKKRLFGILLPFTLLAVSAHAATYTVSSLADSGTGSLRAAIQSANTGSVSTIVFSTSGTISLVTPLPDVTKPTTIDGTTAPGFSGTPTVAIDFNGNEGIDLGNGSNNSSVKSLSLVNSGNAAIYVRSSYNKIQGNYVGIMPDGNVVGNFGDGVRLISPSAGNLIGNANPVTGIDYYDTQDPVEFTVPVTGWQGIRNSGSTTNEFLIVGTSGSNGLVYDGPIDGGGDNYLVQYPGATATSVYGPDNTNTGVRLVGSYRTTGTGNFGFVWSGTLSDLPAGGTYSPIVYPNATLQFVHSVSGDLAVGNADGPATIGKTSLPLGAGKAYIYNVTTGTFVTNIVYPKSKSNTAYGVWKNSETSYTICGGYSPVAVSNLVNPEVPLTQGKGFLVDYDPVSGKFSNWTSFDYPNGPAGVNFATHFQGVSSVEPGIYTVSADSVQAGTSNPAQGSWVTIRRESGGTFDKGTWVDLNYSGTSSLTSSDSVYGNNVVGIVVTSGSTFPYQATVNVGFQLSNVISGNRANGISMVGSKSNAVSMNYIGTDPAGSDTPGYGNGQNGILITGAASKNLIGGVVSGSNNPTGSKVPANAVFQRPAQGNLISGNLGYGVLINGKSTYNVLSGNYIGTTASGTSAMGNGMDGVAIQGSNDNSLLGCTFYNNPFVYYNVIAGNRGHGVTVTSSNDVYVQANFLGMGADNATSVPNGGNGLLVEGSSRATQVGGVIPLGNVIAGNDLNGIEVKDTANNFISFNTFGGIAAFQQFASPNGRNGILITSTGANNTIRTCIISGNNGNGIVIGGNAQRVQITDTSVGTSTTISAAIPNLGHGIVIEGRAHNNAIGGFQPSVEPMVYASGNKGYGIVVRGEAYNNSIYNTTVGEGAGIAGAIPNEEGGVLLDGGTRDTTIGGLKSTFRTFIKSNKKVGLYIFYSKRNSILNNEISDNDEVGVYGFGICTGTEIRRNTIEDNGPSGTTNVDISKAIGITYRP